MNKYEIRVKNAVINSEGLNEYAAMRDLCIFSDIGDMLIGFQTDFEPIQENGVPNVGWIYKVELNGQIELAYVKRIA